MKLLSALPVLLAFASSSFSQTQSRHVISSPDVAPPAEALKSGIGGKVSVKVEVNAAGEVIGVKQVVGPDWVCPDADRPDVAALRETARSVAASVKFSEAKARSTEWVAFTFPTKQTIVSETIDTTQENSETKGLETGKVIKLMLPNHLYSSQVEAGPAPVKVRTVIDEGGKVIWAEPISGHKLLYAGVHKAACNSQFKPSRLNGKPVKITMIITYDDPR